MVNYCTNINKLFWVNLFNNCFWLSSVVTFFYLQRNLSYTDILTLSAIMGLTIILFEVPTGIIADKYGRKVSLLASNLFLIMSIVGYFFANNFISFILIFIISGIGITFSSGATEALIYDSLKKSKKESHMCKSMGHFFSAEVLAGVVTPPIASIIAKDLLAWQFNILIALTLLSYIVSLIILFSIKDIPREKHEKLKFKIPFKDIALLYNHKNLRTLVLNRIFVSIAMSSFMLLWQPQFQASRVPIAWFGVLLAAGSLGIFFVNRNVSWIKRKISPKPLLIISSLVPGLGFIILGTIFNPLIAIGSYLSIRIIASVREPILSHSINYYIPSKNRATILSSISMLSALMTLILKPLIGTLTDTGLTAGFVSLGILCFVSLLIFPIRSVIPALQKNN